MLTEKPSEHLGFEMTQMERRLVDGIGHLLNKPARWRAYSALRHLHFAHKNVGPDPQMSLFRCITGEEEAATALFRILKQKRYVGAEKLLERNHVHKNAVVPFMDAVGGALAALPKIPDVRFAQEGEGFGLLISLGEGAPFFRPMPPLNFTFTRGTTEPGAPMTPVTFAREMERIAGLAAQSPTIEAFLKKRANVRNELLYASDKGFPRASEPEVLDQLPVFRRRILGILKVCVLVAPHPQQSFVQQCLNSFLAILPGLERRDLVF